jgi:hypothetical protein
MNSIVKKLAAGGDTAVEKMLEVASLLGINIIELLWIKEGNQPRMDVSVVVGFQVPIVNNINPQDDVVSPNGWVDGILTFYPDAQGRCWGYVYDTEGNRELIASSLSSGWFKVVDKNTREEINKYAESKGYKITITPKTEVNIKRTFREISADKHAKELENKLIDMQEKMERMKKDLEMAKNERQVHIEKRVAGTPIIPEEIKEL